MNAHSWHNTRHRLLDTIYECYDTLARDYDVIVIEGAGSPAEINLKQTDIVNMGMAKMADAPVLIVGDIDCGGVFASFVGTMQLLDHDERARVKGFIINKFRGDIDLLEPGLKQLEKITGVPVLGVVPWIQHAIDEEDGVSERFNGKEYPVSDIDICVIRLPHISNYTDFIPLEAVPGVRVRWCDAMETIGFPDLLILPGTKATIADLRMLKACGIAEAIMDYASYGGIILGVCGGFQMLGKFLFDPGHAESANSSEQGLGLLDMTTTFCTEKKTVQTTATIHGSSFGLFADLDNAQAKGYEIHMGQSAYGPASAPFTHSPNSNGSEQVTGVADLSGRIAGTYLHGLFDASNIAAGLVNAIRKKKAYRS